ncbi:MAG: type IV pilus twitching motility protein PilT [Fimbriimonadaceae bacterium]|nr:type IV pilus twitching motility protein PilT [Fimbriimonadaceae bacterium]
MLTHIDDLLRSVISHDASDLHLKADNVPLMRIQGDLVHTDLAPLSNQELHDMLFSILTDEQKERIENYKELDLSYFVEGAARFRVNMYWQRGKIGAVFRVIPYKIRTVEELGLPPVTKKLSLLPRGLILVTGPTGSGKSTSLAALINHINESAPSHVMTIEDPIEYVHQDKRAIINQRELGTDTHTFADALKHVMRQNPDVILVGEMRDLETIQLAITAAETGHLVFSTLHTVDAAQTIDRVVDVFPPAQQEQVRTQLSVTLQAVISQTILPRKDIVGRIAAFEVMVATPAIRTMIRDGKTHQLFKDIQTGGDLGMQTLDAHLFWLMKKGYIDYEHAAAKCSNLGDFETRAVREGIITEATHATH